jgi:alkylhydroperoxidase family enzyme
VLLNHPTLARAINDLLATMLWHGRLAPRLRELVIMRIGWVTACDYEWTQHWRVACGLGVPAGDLLAVRALSRKTDSVLRSERCWRPQTKSCATAW